MHSESAVKKELRRVILGCYNEGTAALMALAIPRMSEADAEQALKGLLEAHKTILANSSTDTGGNPCPKVK